MTEFYNRVFIYHNSYNVVFISPVGVQNKDLVQKVPRSYNTEWRKIDYLFFLIIHYSYSYHTNVSHIILLRYFSYKCLPVYTSNNE